MHLAPLILFAISTTITPGPNNFMIMSSSLNFGVRKSIPHYLGICLGFPLMLASVALGMGALFSNYPWLYQVLKYCGGAYMLYLAWLMWRSNFAVKNSASRKPLSLIQALLFQWINPKAWVMAIGATALFVSQQGSILNQTVLLMMTFFVVCIACIGTWMVFGDAMRRFLKNDMQRRIFKYLIIGLLLISVALILFE